MNDQPANENPNNEVYQCLNNHVAESHNGSCQVDGCVYGPNPKPKPNRTPPKNR